MNLLEGLGEAGKAPQVNAGFGLIENHKLTVPGQDGGDLDTLDLAAGEGDIYLPVQIVIGAQAYTASGTDSSWSLERFSLPADR